MCKMMRLSHGCNMLGFSERFTITFLLPEKLKPTIYEQGSALPFWDSTQAQESCRSVSTNQKEIITFLLNLVVLSWN